MKSLPMLNARIAVLRALGFQLEYELRLAPTKGRRTPGVLIKRGQNLDELLRLAETKRVALQTNRRVQVKLLITLLDKPGSFMGQDMQTSAPAATHSAIDAMRAASSNGTGGYGLADGGVVIGTATEWKPSAKMREAMKAQAITLPKPTLRASGVALSPLPEPGRIMTEAESLAVADKLLATPPIETGPLVWDEEKQAYVHQGAQ